MQRSRFIFVQTTSSVVAADRPGERMLWLLVSSNNRRLGQDVILRETYAESRAAVTQLRDGRSAVTAHTAIDRQEGRWIWRLQLDGVTVAASSRSYLRTRECDYNLQRFLDALATADVVPGARRVVAGRSQWTREQQSSSPAATTPSMPMSDRWIAGVARRSAS